MLLSVVGLAGMAACGNEILAPGLNTRRVTVAAPGDGGSDGDPGPANGDPTPADDDVPPAPPVIHAFVAASADGQSAFAGEEVTQAPAVVVRDQYGAPMAGQVVRFSIEAGEGKLEPETVTTDAQGRAEVDFWQLGKRVVPQQLRARLDAAPGVSSVLFNATVLSSYTITVQFLSTVTDQQRRAFEGAAARWSAVVVGELPDFQYSRSMLPNGCGRDPSDTTPVAVDDMIIYASVKPIDGPSNVLAQAGPCAQHPSGAIKSGIMSFDSDDIGFLETNNVLEGTILHEMGHVIGIGPTWTPSGLIISPSIGSPGANTRFVGENAAAAFAAMGGTGFPDTVPVENNGVPGTADAHWRESIFGIELMSPSISGAESSLPLSSVTIASINDLGVYTVNTSAADDFVFGMALRAGPTLPPLGECRTVMPSEFMPLGGGTIEAR